VNRNDERGTMNDELKSGQLSVVSCPLFVADELSYLIEGIEPAKLEQLTTDN
jgi:hypothetical protein